jgi:anaerobic selenocysteine-containing dehydrogenase
VDAEPLAPHDAYSLRLVASRKLYDQGVATSTSPALAVLAPGSTLRINRYDFDRLGVTEGDTVRLTSPRTSVPAVVALDTTLPRGSVGVWFNQPGICAADLTDASLPVTIVQVDTMVTGGGA